MISRSILLFVLILLEFCCPLSLRAQQATSSPVSRDRYKPGLAENAAVEKVIRDFKGKGEVGDDSEPTPATEAVKQFRLAPGLKIDLLASEPAVMQPLYISFDPKGRMWVTQYQQYPFPAGLKVVRYDQYLRAVFDDVPRPPPHHVPGKDKITVFEDTDGDGLYDAHRDAITGLNIATAAVVGAGGIWVLNPPYLLFYPDADGDAVPDSDPQVKLRGFGLEDTHAIANSLAWGPDGWLYGANGSTTTANVTSKGSPPVAYEGQCIWRFHPQQGAFEVYAEGGGNTFSMEFDCRGRVFSGTNHGNTRGMFYPQGSYGTKNFGKHGPLTNPYAFGYFEHMAHQGDKDRFPQTFVIYEGGTLPEKYNGNVIAANALHNRVWASELLRDGSTYRTTDMEPNVCETGDRWFRPVDVKVGPDGGVYLADWYDTRLTHVDPRDNWHKTSGRLYRIQGSDVSPAPMADLTTLADGQLIDLFSHPNKWQQQTAVRVLSERLKSLPPPQRTATLNILKTIWSTPQPRALQALWVYAEAAGLHDDDLPVLLQHPDADVRRWAVRLLGDQRNVSAVAGEELARLAADEQEVQVRSQLACSAKRFETSVALPILTALIGHEEDQYDRHMPLLIWWAFEGHCGNEELQFSPNIGIPLAPREDVVPRVEVLKLFEDGKFWDSKIVRETLLARLMRRFAMEPVQTPQTANGITGMQACTRLLALAPSPEHSRILMTGFLEAYQGRSIDGLPEELKAAIAEYRESLGKSDLVLGVRLGDAAAIDKALAAIRDEKRDPASRLVLIETFGQISIPKSVSVLVSLLRSPNVAVRKGALQSLMRYSNPDIARRICDAYHSTLTDEAGQREAALQALASRPNWTAQFLSEIEQFRIPVTSVPADVIQQMRLHTDPEIQARIDKLWGHTRATNEQKLQEIERLRKVIAAPLPAGLSLQQAREAGGQLFKQHCATCHTLFSQGGQTGPNLTGYERTNLGFLLLAIVDPSAGIREEFTQFQIVTVDGRILTGLVTDQSPNTVTLRGANNQLQVIARDQIDILQAMPTSLMPEGLMQKLSDQQTVELFAYLMQPTP